MIEHSTSRSLLIMKVALVWFPLPVPGEFQGVPGKVTQHVDRSFSGPRRSISIYRNPHILAPPLSLLLWRNAKAKPRITSSVQNHGFTKKLRNPSNILELTLTIDSSNLSISVTIDSSKLSVSIDRSLQSIYRLIGSSDLSV